MSMINVALLQMTAGGTDQEANKAKGAAFCRRAHAMGADIALFPEMWNIGYTPYVPWEQLTAADDVWRAPELWTPQDAARFVPKELIARWQAQAIGRDSHFIIHFRALAKELDMAIALTYLERWPGAPRNTVSLIDRHGDIVLTYAKVHTCDFSMEAACTSGDDFYVCTLDTANGPVAVGAMICYDREFPESARVLMLKGAELILTPNSCPLETNRIGQFRARAYENMVGVAMTNYAAPQNNGHSVALTPWASTRTASRATRLSSRPARARAYTWRRSTWTPYEPTVRARRGATRSGGRTAMVRSRPWPSTRPSSGPMPQAIDTTRRIDERRSVACAPTKATPAPRCPSCRRAIAGA